VSTITYHEGHLKATKLILDAITLLHYADLLWGRSWFYPHMHWKV